MWKFRAIHQLSDQFSFFDSAIFFFLMCRISKGSRTLDLLPGPTCSTRFLLTQVQRRQAKISIVSSTAKWRPFARNAGFITKTCLSMLATCTNAKDANRSLKNVFVHKDRLHSPPHQTELEMLLICYGPWMIEPIVSDSLISCDSYLSENHFVLYFSFICMFIFKPGDCFPFKRSWLGLKSSLLFHIISDFFF